MGALGLEADERPIQHLGENWSGAVGVSPTSAPTDYKFSTALGGGRELDSGVEVVDGLDALEIEPAVFRDDGAAGATAGTGTERGAAGGGAGAGTVVGRTGAGAGAGH